MFLQEVSARGLCKGLVPELVLEVADTRKVPDAGGVRGVAAAEGALREVAVLLVLGELLDGLAGAVAGAVVGA